MVAAKVSRNFTKGSVREFEWRDKDFKFLAGLLHEKTGIVLNEKKREMMYGRLVRRLRVLNIKSFAEYCNYLRSSSGKEELNFTLNAITTNTTNFFREKHHFAYLQDQILPPLRKQLEQNPQHHFRIWSAGCSSGQEPYSIAMVMRKALGKKSQNSKILATDIDNAVLATGSLGQYDAKLCQETIPRIFLASHSRKIKNPKADLVEISDEIKQYISFKQLNLLHDWPMKGTFDVIFCRNVMIYFNKETQNQLVQRFAQYLKPGGILFIGHAESLLSVTDIFKCVGKTIYRKIS